MREARTLIPEVGAREERSPERKTRLKPFVQRKGAQIPPQKNPGDMDLPLNGCGDEVRQKRGPVASP